MLPRLADLCRAFLAARTPVAQWVGRCTCPNGSVVQEQAFSIVALLEVIDRRERIIFEQCATGCTMLPVLVFQYECPRLQHARRLIWSSCRLYLRAASTHAWPRLTQPHASQPAPLHASTHSHRCSRTYRTTTIRDAQETENATADTSCVHLEMQKVYPTPFPQPTLERCYM